jgi:hypothetical protein
VISSPLEQVQELNDHLVWFWSLLKHKRRLLGRLQASGCEMTCLCTGCRGPIIVRPNGAEMLHLLGVRLEVDVARVRESR